ncbi:MAG: MoaD/ThiS family protein [Nitrososphaerales archaeon]|nr:MoaD/ThiS family protein [Nitrososphaerales archaeon]
MIRVKAYGHIGRALGRAELEIDRDEIRVRDLLDLITSSEGRFTPSLLTMLVTVNGVEISALDREDTIVKSGEEVILIPVTHGG